MISLSTDGKIDLDEQNVCDQTYINLLKVFGFLGLFSKKDLSRQRQKSTFEKKIL